MAFIFYNKNPDDLRVGDCVVRAIAKAENMSWYDTYIDIRKDTLYRLWEEGELKTLYLNRRAYNSGDATVLIGDATIYVSDDGVLISDILESDARIIIDTPLIGTIGNAVEIDNG